MKMDKSGYVYVLSNPAMPGLVKIGRSQYGGKKRAKQIYSQGGTAVPAEFHMEFEIWSDDCHACESEIHEELQDYRVSSGREFFSLDKDQAIKSVIDVVGSRYGVKVGYAECTLTEWDLMPSYGMQAHDVIVDLFPGVPVEYTLTAAICDFLDHSSIKDAIKRLRNHSDMVLGGEPKQPGDN